MNKQKTCKRCKGRGIVFEGKRGEDCGAYMIKTPYSTGLNSSKGKTCPACGGRGLK